MPDYSIKLTEKEVTDIRWEFWNSSVTQNELASRYQVSPSQISQIIRRKSWPCLPKVNNEL